MGRWDRLNKAMSTLPEEAKGARALVEGPHSIFSVENGLQKAEDIMPKLSTDETMEVLRDAGLSPHMVEGKYGAKENSILLPNPTPEAEQFINEMARSTGQESVIKSTGKQHQLEYTLGDKKGLHHPGEGTTFHASEPEDFYTKIHSEGTPEYFTHNINFDKTIDPKAPRFGKLKRTGAAGIAMGGVGSQFVDPAEAAKQAYGLYNEYVQEPVSKVADKMSQKLLETINPAGMPNREKIIEEQKPMVKFGGEMAMDPINAFGPMAKAPAALGAGMLARKEAAKIFNAALKRAAEEGKPIGKVVSEMLLGKLPFGGDDAMRNLEQQRFMMRDVLGHGLMEKHGMSDADSIAKAVRTGTEKMAPGFPQDKIMLMNANKKMEIMPSGRELPAEMLRSSTGTHANVLLNPNGNISGLGIRADSLPPQSQTTHQIMGLMGHELGHADNAVQYGIPTTAASNPLNRAVFDFPGGSIDRKLDMASEGHHLGLPNEKQTFEKTSLDNILNPGHTFANLQSPVKNLTDEQAIAKLIELQKTDPFLYSKTIEGMEANPRSFYRLSKLLNK